MGSLRPRKKPSYYAYDFGLKIPRNLYIPGHVEKALTYCPIENDVFVATYPKCGTTWTQYILYLLLNKGVPMGKDDDLYTFSPHLEDNGKEAVEVCLSPRIIKTHLPYHLIPKSNKARYIYVARNPRDVCVSFYYHTIGFGKLYDFEDGSFDDFFEVFLDGFIEGGDYFDHLLSYYKHRNEPNVLFLLYENMKEDITKCVLKIADFLGGPFLEAAEDPNILKDVLKYSSFESMKTLCLWNDRPKDLPFLRNGKVGQWKEQFSQEQSKRLNEKFYSKLSGTGAECLWNSYC